MNLLLQVWATLLPAERRRAVLVLGLMLMAAAFEMVSIGLVVPVLGFMTSDSAELPAAVRDRIAWFADLTSARAVVIVLLGLVGVYALKAVFLVGVAYWQSRFVRSVQANVSRRLFSAVIAQPWTFHLQRNSGATTHVLEESQMLSQVCMYLLQIVSESLVGLSLLGVLLWFEPVGATIVATMVLFAIWLLNGFVRPHSRRWAAARNHHAQMLRQQMQKVLGGVKEVKIHGCEREFAHDFRLHTDASTRNATRQWVVEQLPRPCFELLAVVMLFLLTVGMVWQGGSIRSLLPILGLYAAVAFRMLPSINHATIAAQRLRHVEPMIASLRQNLAMEASIPKPGPMALVPFRDAIRLEKLSYRYPGGDGDVLREIDITIPHGAAVGIIGGSGAGKSTLVDVLLGLLPPTTGRVTVDGFDIQHNLRGWQDVIAYVPQAVYLLDDSIRRNVAFGVPEKVIDDEFVRRALVAAQLDDFVRRLPDGVATVVGERGVRLSGGQRQRIAIARALYFDPQVLVLDEATSALDTDTEREVMAAVEALHCTKTLIIVAHRLSTVEKCDALYQIEDGTIVCSGSFADVVAAASSPITP